MNVIHFFVATTTSSTPSTEVEEQVSKRVGALQKFWESIRWDDLVATVVTKAVSVLLFLVLFAILYKIGRIFINRAYRAYGKRIGVNEVRATTLQRLIDNVFQYSMLFLFIYTLLWIIGVPVASLLTGAGIAGLAIGLGAQGFMNDLITGFFIIVEQQLDVGDHIKLAGLNIDGVVVQVGIRTTKLKGLDGAIHYIPNRNITTITNLSRSDIRVVVDTRINLDEGIDNILPIIQQTTDTLAEKFHTYLQTTPNVFGLVDLGNGNYAIRVSMYVINGEQFRINEAFVAEYIRAMTDAGFTIPNNPIPPMNK
ncbi:small conductance mechanosensitive channel [Pilibacter termitis]|uniref:Small conductance mechanosensitive channel n=1 Tax=Pilibacter termitis TaxID=263852 RepID=A0A1T4K8K8_9ENTE|nr:mechanosensitive ion channel family protein [Pilibacter termitis]SJZ38741.1 small conductance mechanosensitive channel [Pilibacter termitis]